MTIYERSRTQIVLPNLKTYSLYHENLLSQKFNDTFTQVLENFHLASDIMEAIK